MTTPSTPPREPAPPMLRGLLWLVLLVVFTLVFMLLAFFFYQSSGLALQATGRGWRYVWIPPLVLTWVFYTIARYTQQVYRLPYWKDGFQYMLAAMFGLGYPVLVIPEERAAGENAVLAEENLVNLVGGPGYLAIQPGHVVLLENYQGSLRVVGQGRHYITHLETVKETVGLEERRFVIEKITATTRDGIEVLVKDVSFRYRLHHDANPVVGPARTPENPFPYSEAAVIAMTYNRNYNQDGPANWNAGIVNAVDTIITDYIRSNPIDHLSAPNQGEDPRQAITSQFYSPSGKARFRERGAELLWIDIGHFDTVDDQIAAQRVDTWKRRWSGAADVLRAQGEARISASQEIARAQGQADLLRELVKGLEDAGLSGDTAETRRRLMLLRMNQLLNTLSVKVSQRPSDSSGEK